MCGDYASRVMFIWEMRSIYSRLCVLVVDLSLYVCVCVFGYAKIIQGNLDCFGLVRILVQTDSVERWKAIK